MYRIIDVKNWKRSKQYNWFSSFSNPCYGIDATIDVTEVVKFSKMTKTSFFINFLYVVSKSLNEVEEMRLRVVDGEVRLYDVIHPTYTIKTAGGSFENGSNKMSFNYYKFYVDAHKEIEKKKPQLTVVDAYNTTEYNVFYLTCLPWLEFDAFTHPIPSGNIESLSVPRICWSKFTEKDGRYTLTLNITVSHALVDGEPLAKVFNLIKENSANVKKIIEK